MYNFLIDNKLIILIIIGGLILISLFFIIFFRLKDIPDTNNDLLDIDFLESSEDDD